LTRSGFGQQYISGLEQGQRNPTVVTLYEQALAVGVTPLDLRSRRRSRSPSPYRRAKMMTTTRAKERPIGDTYSASGVENTGIRPSYTERRSGVIGNSSARRTLSHGATASSRG
jgi:transcriptional regulator with XRE-family HTH domain